MLVPVSCKPLHEASYVLLPLALSFKNSISGPVYTMPDKFENFKCENGTKVLCLHMETDKVFCVHTTPFLGPDYMECFSPG